MRIQRNNPALGPGSFIFFNNPIVWVAIAALGVLVLVALVYFIWRYTSKDPYSIGYRKGKKIVGIEILDASKKMPPKEFATIDLKFPILKVAHR